MVITGNLKPDTKFLKKVNSVPVAKQKRLFLYQLLTFNSHLIDTQLNLPGIKSDWLCRTLMQAYFYHCQIYQFYISIFSISLILSSS